MTKADKLASEMAVFLLCPYTMEALSMFADLRGLFRPCEEHLPKTLPCNSITWRIIKCHCMGLGRA